MDVFERKNDVFGSPFQCAIDIGERKQALSNSRRRCRIPAEKCRTVFETPNGQIRLHEMRPDIYSAA